MSQENVEILRKGIAAWNQRDADLWLSYAAPEIDWLPAGRAAVDSTVYRGSEECARGSAVRETWAVFEFQEESSAISEIRSCGLGASRCAGALVRLNSTKSSRFTACCATTRSRGL